MSAIQVSPWWHWAPVLHVTPSTVRVSPLRYIYIYMFCLLSCRRKTLQLLLYPLPADIFRNSKTTHSTSTRQNWRGMTPQHFRQRHKTCQYHQSSITFLLIFQYMKCSTVSQLHKNYIIPFHCITWNCVSFYILPSPDTNLRTCHQLLPYRGPIHRDHGYYDSVEDEVLGWDTLQATNLFHLLEKENSSSKRAKKK